MTRQPQLYDWQEELARRLPPLAPSYVGLLALWSLGMVLTKACGLVVITRQLMPLLGQGFDTVRQHLREFYQEADAKAGAKRGIKRQDFTVSACFAPLLRWVLSYWSARRVALALDVTNVGDRLHILCISVLYGGIGIPVAWKVLPGNAKGAWNPHWDQLLSQLQRALGEGWQVLVLSDRGLESAWLFRAIRARGWHPLMRVKAAGTFRPEGWVRWYPFTAFAARPGNRFVARGRAYKSAEEPLDCTLLTCWQAPHAEPWLLLTDLPPQAANPCWYAWRAWIEQGFKVIKGGGLHWQKTRMDKPERLERMWLALAVTTLWLVAIGAEVERLERLETVGPLPAGAEPAAARKQRLFHLGLTTLIAALVRGNRLPQAHLPDQAWPPPTPIDFAITEQEFVSSMTYS